MSKPLFDSFNAVSAKEWKQKIQFDLKGADYNEALIHKSFEGIDIKPFYNQEDLIEIKHTITHPYSWKNAQKINVTKAITGNKIAIDAIKKGAETIYFNIITDTVDPKELLSGISTDIPIYIQTSFLSSKYIQKLDTESAVSNHQIHLLTDIIGNLAKTGNWYATLKKDHQTLDTIINNCTHLKNILSVDMSLFQNAGATMIQQLAYGLAHANEYLNHFDKDNGNTPNKSIIFKVAVGSNYFFEIAKLRALRILWNTLSTEYKTNNTCHILAHPSHRNKTILDYNVNMLRTTTECMSAILGGADTIYNLRYDDIFNTENDFGTRIAINQLLILKNESYFDIVSNPATGSYYIESLTDKLAEKALDLFKNIEENGGYLKQLKSGTIQEKIKQSAKKEQELYDNEDIILTGANKFKNPEESTPISQKPEPQNNSYKKTLLNPIIKRRLSKKK